ncbi:MAG: glycine cleavage T C-terminal barrel domain-containing protein [Planctomycetota bacterium]
MRSSLLAPPPGLERARLAPRPEAPLFTTLLTGGDVPAEYRAGREGVLLLDATDRGEVRARGRDAADFLHRILANRVRDLGPGEGARNLLLTPQGKVRFDVDLLRDEEEIRLSTPPGAAAVLFAALEAYVFSEDLALADTTAQHAPLELAGPGAAPLVSRVFGAEPPAGPRAWRRMETSGGPVVVAAVSVAGGTGFRIDAGPERAVELWRAFLAAGAVVGGIAARDILRVEAVAALWGVDVDENVYPQEARLEDAFSLAKGCYTGQEVVAKIDTYGGLNKRLFPLRVDHDDPVPRGTRLLSGEEGERRDLGVVTSWAYSFALDGGLALAFVKRKHQEVGTRFVLGDGSGTATIVAEPVG